VKKSGLSERERERVERARLSLVDVCRRQVDGRCRVGISTSSTRV